MMPAYQEDPDTQEINHILPKTRNVQQKLPSFNPDEKLQKDRNIIQINSTKLKVDVKNKKVNAKL